MIDDSIEYTDETDYLKICIDKAEIAINPNQILEFDFTRNSVDKDPQNFVLTQRELKILLVNRDKILSYLENLKKSIGLFQDGYK